MCREPDQIWWEPGAEGCVTVAENRVILLSSAGYLNVGQRTADARSNGNARPRSGNFLLGVVEFVLLTVGAFRMSVLPWVVNRFVHC